MSYRSSSFRHGEAAFEAVIENHLLNHGYVKITDKCDSN
jgi:hypothetical protein